jgi:hypothetical protein
MVKPLTVFAGNGRAFGAGGALRAGADFVGSGENPHLPRTK